jgi:hypothetical protein
MGRVFGLISDGDDGQRHCGWVGWLGSSQYLARVEVFQGSRDGDVRDWHAQPTGKVEGMCTYVGDHGAGIMDKRGTPSVRTSFADSGTIRSGRVSRVVCSGCSLVEVAGTASAALVTGSAAQAFGHSSVTGGQNTHAWRGRTRG